MATDYRPCKGDAFHQHPMRVIAPDDDLSCHMCAELAPTGKCIGEDGYEWLRVAQADRREPLPEGWHEVTL
jgi:hypothetical protein